MVLSSRFSVFNNRPWSEPLKNSHLDLKKVCSVSPKRPRITAYLMRKMSYRISTSSELFKKLDTTSSAASIEKVGCEPMVPKTSIPTWVMRLGYANAGSSVKSAIGTCAMTKKAACTLDNQQQKQHAKVPLVARQKLSEDRDDSGVFTHFNHSGLLRKNSAPNRPRISP